MLNPDPKVIEAKLYKMLLTAATMLLMSVVLWLSLWGVLSFFSLPIPNLLQVLSAVVLLGIGRNEVDGLRKWWSAR